MQNSQLGHHIGPPIRTEEVGDADLFSVFKRLARRWEEYILIQSPVTLEQAN